MASSITTEVLQQARLMDQANEYREAFQSKQMKEHEERYGKIDFKIDDMIRGAINHSMCIGCGGKIDNGQNMRIWKSGKLAWATHKNTKISEECQYRGLKRIQKFNSLKACEQISKKIQEAMQESSKQ